MNILMDKYQNTVLYISANELTAEYFMLNYLLQCKEVYLLLVKNTFFIYCKAANTLFSQNSTIYKYIH